MGKENPTKDSVFETTRKMISDFMQYPEDQIKLETELIELGFDSLDMVELSMDLEYIFDISVIDDEDIEKCNTVNDLVELLIKEIKNGL